MIKSRGLPFLYIAYLFVFSIPCFAQNPEAVKWEKYDGGFFSIEIPQGWKITTAGECSMFSFIVQDPQNSLRRIFYFGQVGPFYLNELQRRIDYGYMRMNGFPVRWIDMPVIEPLAAENFFKNFYLIAQAQSSRNFIPNVPSLNNFEVISAISRKSFIVNSDTKVIRALFSEFNNVGEGMFYVAAAIFTPYDGISAGVGTGMGFSCTGISSYKNDFKIWEPVLLKSLHSLVIGPAYISQCKNSQDTIWNNITQINKIWDDVSDTISQSWQKKSKGDDILSEKRSDAMLGKERLYDPDTGEVYEFEVGFYEKYNIHRQDYKKTNLEPLDDNDWELWTKPAKQGSQAF